MQFSPECNGLHAPSGNPFLLMTDVDSPEFQSQIMWSLMYILQQRSIAGVAFDKDNVNTYNKLHAAIASMITAALPSKATVAELRTGTDDSKFATALGVTAALGGYSKYVSVSTTPYAVLAADIGAVIIASGAASIFNLPLVSTVARIGATYTFLNLTSNNITINRNSTDTLSGVSGSTTAVTIAPRQYVTLVKLSNALWAVIGSVIGEISTKLNALPFQKEWVGDWTAYQSNPTAAGFVYSDYEYNHTLGVVPKLMMMEIQCLQPQGGYLLGEVFDMPVSQSSEQGSQDCGYAVKKTAAKVFLSFDTNHGMQIHEWGNQANFRPNNISFMFRFKAWA